MNWGKDKAKTWKYHATHFRIARYGRQFRNMLCASIVQIVTRGLEHILATRHIYSKIERNPHLKAETQRASAMQRDELFSFALSLRVVAFLLRLFTAVAFASKLTYSASRTGKSKSLI